MPRYGLFEPFDIDDQSLRGVSPEMAFALGAEWRMFYEKVMGSAPFSCLVLERNAERLAGLASRHGRFNESRVADGAYVEIFVGGRD